MKLGSDKMDLAAMPILKPIGNSIGSIITSTIQYAITNNIVTTLVVDQTCDSFYQICNLLYKLDRKQFVKHMAPHFDDWFKQLGNWQSYCIRMNRLNCILVNTSVDKEKTQEVALTFIGPDRYKIKNKIIKISSNYIPKGCTSFYQRSEKRNYTTANRMVIKTFDQLVMRDADKSYIINNITQWIANKKWYHKNGLVHKLGILLYGQPGTGKTSVIRAVSHMLNDCPVIAFNYHDYELSTSHVLDTVREYSGYVIVVFEDIDFYITKRDGDKDFLQYKRDSIQNQIFQILDGYYSSEKVIYIATTNHIDKLDPALIRPGRFDLCVEMPFFDKPMAEEFIRSRDVSMSVLDDVTYPISPADLQSRILNSKFIKRGDK